MLQPTIKLKGKYPAPRLDFAFVAGDAFNLEISYTDGTSEPVDLTLAASLRWRLRRTIGGAVLVEKTNALGIVAGVGTMTAQIDTQDTIAILGMYAAYSPLPFVYEATIDYGSGEFAICWGVCRIYPTVAKVGQQTIPTYTYYVDPINGNDANNGLSAATAWKTNTAADAIVIGSGSPITVGYLYRGYWRLYRAADMSSVLFLLPSSIYTAPSDKF